MVVVVVDEALDVDVEAIFGFIVALAFSTTLAEVTLDADGLKLLSGLRVTSLAT